MRLLCSLTEKQLTEYIETGGFSTPWPEPPGVGESELDHLDPNTLMHMFQEDQRKFDGRDPAEYDFCERHGHWPEQPCGDRCKKMERENVNVKEPLESTPEYPSTQRTDEISWSRT